MQVFDFSKLFILQTYGSQYMVGVLDKETNEMTLRPASLINLKPYVKSFEDEEVKKEKEMSYGEKYKELAMKFGANRIQKTLRGKFFLLKVFF